ncbi:MAG TPA: hypothetical protein IAB56_07015 [Candidatus Scybalousia intestinigallinarum]|nr:hypothetical protein [Candidatus Scybalousia intestinigallinarum]
MGLFFTRYVDNAKRQQLVAKLNMKNIMISSLLMTKVYWNVGKITYELSKNSTKAGYRKKIIDALSSKLIKEFGSVFFFSKY